MHLYANVLMVQKTLTVKTDYHAMISAELWATVTYDSGDTEITEAETHGDLLDPLDEHDPAYLSAQLDSV